MVSLKFTVHLLDLLLGLRNLILPGLNLALQLTDLVVQNKLELLQLLILLLQVIDPLLFISNRLISLLDLILQGFDILFKTFDFLIQTALCLEEAVDFLILVTDVLLECVKLLPHDTILSFQPQEGLPLTLQFVLILLLDLLNLLVCINLQLPADLLVLPAQILLLLPQGLIHLLLHCQGLLEVLLHLLPGLLHLRVFVPKLVHEVSLLGLQVTLELCYLLLAGLLLGLVIHFHFRGLTPMLLCHIPSDFREIDVLLILQCQEALILLCPLLHLLFELIRHLLDLLLMFDLAPTLLVIHIQLQLLHFGAQFVDHSILLLQITLRDEDFLCKRDLTFRRSSILVLHIIHIQ
mmetsp:Transcript_33956/g.60906  ORF Transcript_33956/g.60906 Transcript_33956/m.60906 type:complete len:350 (-) Transcript_33956:1974-3023(-)